MWRSAQVWLLTEVGRLDDARRLFAEYPLDPVAGVVESWPFTIPYQLGLAAWRLDDADMAARVIAALTPYRECWAHYYILLLGPVSEALGLAHATLGAYDEAVPLLEEALAMATEQQTVAYIPDIRAKLDTVRQRRDAAATNP